MINLEMFLLLLLIVSVMTGLCVQGIKVIMDEYKLTYHSNTLAGIIAIVLSILVFAAYVILIDATINTTMAVFLIALVLLSWLCAMIGYDKVVQAISQFRK